MTGQLNDWLQTEGLVDLSPRLENLGIHDIDEMAKISDVAATQLAGEVGMNQVSTQRFNNAVQRLRESPRTPRGGQALPQPHVIAPVRSTQLPKLVAKAKVLPSWFKSAVSGGKKTKTSSKYDAGDDASDDNF